MSFKITGLNVLQKNLDQAAKALGALDGELTTLKFNPDDPASVEAALVQMEGAIEAKIAPFRGNKIIEEFADNLKSRYRQAINDRVASARLKRQGSAMSVNIDPSIFRQIEDVISDLQSSDHNTFDRHIKKLARLLHSSELEPITSSLTNGVDIIAWLNAAHKERKLNWPTEAEKELGIIILLIDRFAGGGQKVSFPFAHSFFYTGGTRVSSDLHNMTRHMLVPFAREYINYVKVKTGTPEATLLPTRSGPAARKIFIVHGHDEGVKQAVARFVEKLGFEAIILHEQASQGRTIIEKIEAHADVGFAVVLLTADDTGGLKGEPLGDRARQNVILELGYFIARLGRSRVLVLKRGDLDVPSDLGGVVYQAYDDGGGWKTVLGQELKAAGFDIDWNLVMQPMK